MSFYSIGTHSHMEYNIELLYYGFIQSAFKFQTRNVTTCWNNGAAMAKQTWGMAVKYWTDPYINAEDFQYDLNDALVRLVSACNIFDSIEGTILFELFIAHLISTEHVMLGYILRLIIFANMLPDVVETSAAVMAWMQHMDPYNKGRIAGKLLKITVHNYFNGVLPYFFEGFHGLTWLDSFFGLGRVYRTVVDGMHKNA